MTTHIRKLLPPLEDHNPTFISTDETQESENSNNYNISYSNTVVKLDPPIDSAMALAISVLLTALFFMGFFSIYFRRSSDESSVNPTRIPSISSKGVDPTVVKSLPVHAYFPGEVNQGIIEEMECAICLGEFEEKECVKEIPYCGHVFHVECIDTWLLSHVTCPLCRTMNLLVEDREKGVVVMEGHVERGDVESGGEMNGGDTFREVESRSGTHK